MIAIIDYGVGNIGSILNMLNRINKKSFLVSNAEDLKYATHIILPGVGSFDDGMTKLIDSHLINAIEHRVFNDQIPILGICLGAQMMTLGSEEGCIKGLGWIDASTVKFNSEIETEPLLLPNIGWRYVDPKGGYPLVRNFENRSKFYFVHSYHMVPNSFPEGMTVLESFYGSKFFSAISFKNIHLVQFHPEKSHRYGLQFFEKFIEMA